MWFRQTGLEHRRRKGAGNRAALKAIVDRGQVPGLLAYVDGLPAGWCSVAPREEFGRLQRSRTLKAIDDRPAWSIVCFFVRGDFRNRGLAAALLGAAVRYAVERGARIVEAYPFDPSSGGTPDSAVYSGVVSMFEEAGFREVARRSRTTPIMRYLAAG
jgi:GNAT superfamily N-acetyltransferase